MLQLDHMRMKKRFLRNILQVIIGGVMLIMSYNYVQAHDAEKTNFISGITVLKQKVTLLIDGLLGQGTTQDFARHQEMIRNYKELLSYLETTQCDVSVKSEDMKQKLQILESLTPIDYKIQSIQYSSYASQVYEELQKCIHNKQQ